VPLVSPPVRNCALHSIRRAASGEGPSRIVGLDLFADSYDEACGRGSIVGGPTGHEPGSEPGRHKAALEDKPEVASPRNSGCFQIIAPLPNAFALLFQTLLRLLCEPN